MTKTTSSRAKRASVQAPGPAPAPTATQPATPPAAQPSTPPAAPTAPAARFYDGRRYHAADSVGHLMHQIVFATRRDIEARMSLHGLTAAQWYPLWKLKTGAANTAQALARQMDIDAGAMTRLVDRLEAKGLIGRERSATDRRVMRLSLTAAGEAVAAHIPQVLADVNNGVLAGFSEAEWQQLLGLLLRLRANTQPAASPRD